MKKLLVSGIAAAAFCGAPSLAADMPTKGPVYKAAPAPMFNWSGFYVGGNVGYGWGNVEWTADATTNLSLVRHRNDINGWMGGAQVGWQQQWNNTVGGFELSWSGGDLNSGRDPIRFAGQTRTFEARVDSLFLAVARLGVAKDQWLLYGKGGFASGEVRTQVRDLTGGFGPGFLLSAAEKRQNGWTLGAGIDYALTNNWIFGLEYNYISLGSKTVNNVNQPGVFPINHENIDPRFSTVMARLSYKFGGDAWGKSPVVAKY